MKKVNFFDEEKKKAAEKWLNQKISNKACVCCGVSRWILSENLAVPASFENGEVTLGEYVTPMFMRICSNCGNTVFHNAVIMGLLNSIEEVNDKKEKNNV